MEEGSLRCDANISVRLVGAPEFGTKVEVKNMNSMRNVQRAIEFEIERQIIAIEKGEIIAQETRSFDALKGTTISMRSKEAANDYRYFPEPDLQPIAVDEIYIQQVKSKMPALPRDLFAKYTKEYSLSDYDAGILTDTKAIALYFEGVVAHTKNYKNAANWIMGDVKSFLNQNGYEMEDFPVSTLQLANLINLIESGKVSHSAASQKLFPELIKHPTKTAKSLVDELNLSTNSDSGFIEELVDQVLAEFPEKVQEYQSGKKGLLGMFVGEVMKRSKGKADPKITNQLVSNKLG
jgi:aspartyl-tRNA(Asn)/glutamyl-tRNA(Gln) amidotransferase subunit B